MKKIHRRSSSLAYPLLPPLRKYECKVSLVGTYFIDMIKGICTSSKTYLALSNADKVPSFIHTSCIRLKLKLIFSFFLK